MSNLLQSMNISASGMAAQRTRMDVVSENIANVNTTVTENGGVYHRKRIVFSAAVQDANGVKHPGVSVKKIYESNAPLREVYDPSNPQADDNGIVRYPNVNTTEETMEMLAATRSFEANTAAFEASKKMLGKMLSLMK